LSDDASVNAKPALEIYADDVKCSHGSTTGQLDEKALFYLRSRGISQDRAVQLLLEGFLSEVINEVKNESLRNRVKAYVSVEKA
jgi:Fe-S cluster assembly protein SufD